MTGKTVKTFCEVFEDSVGWVVPDSVELAITGGMEEMEDSVTVEQITELFIFWVMANFPKVYDNLGVGKVTQSIVKVRKQSKK